MAVENIETVGEFDPERCEGLAGNNQCRFRRVPGSRYCPVHDKQSSKRREKELHMYMLGQWQARTQELANHDDLRTVNQELGLLRMLLERIVNMCSSDNDIEIRSSKIESLVTRIEHMVVTCNNLEMKTGKVLDKSALLRIAGSIIDIITKHIPDQELCGKIGDEIVERILIEQPISKDEAKDE